MPIRPRGNSFQVDVVLNGHRRQVSVKTYQEATKKEQELIDELKGLGTTTEPLTLDKALHECFKRYWLGSKSEASYLRKINTIIAEWPNDCLLADITPAALDAWVDRMKNKGNQNSTINRYLSAVNMAFKWAGLRGGYQAAAPKTERLKEPIGRIRWLSNEEEVTLLKLLADWGKVDLWDSVVLLLDTGMRSGELLKLQVRDFTPASAEQRGRVTLWDTKNGKSRTQPLTERANAVLVRRTLTQPYKFFPYNENWLRLTWDRIKGLMGLQDDPQFIPYCLRHTYASRLAQRGVSLQVIQKLMGHETIAMTLRYAHLAQGHLDAGIDCLDRPVKVTPVTSQVTVTSSHQMA